MHDGNVGGCGGPALLNQTWETIIVLVFVLSLCVMLDWWWWRLSVWALVLGLTFHVCLLVRKGVARKTWTGADGIPVGLKEAIMYGNTCGALLYVILDPRLWRAELVNSAAFHHQAHTLSWLTILGCPCRPLVFHYTSDIACLRWLLMQGFRTNSMVYKPSNAMRLILRHDTDIRDETTFHFHSSDPVCGVELVRRGCRVLDEDRGRQCMFLALSRVLEDIPRDHASRIIQRHWLSCYYTPGRTVWHKRMMREFVENCDLTGLRKAPPPSILAACH